MPMRYAIIAIAVWLSVHTTVEAHLPVIKGRCISSMKGFRTLVSEHRETLRELLNEHGALLFRSFPFHTAEDFSSAIRVILQQEPTDYRSGEESRQRVIEGVYTSTEAPPEFSIPLHHEFSYTDYPWAYVAYFCQIPHDRGSGQMLLASTKNVHDRILQRPDIWEKFEGKVIKYTSRHPPEGSIFCAVNPTHKAWQEAFETDDPKVAEAICRSQGFDFRWLGGWLEVIRRAPAIRDPDEHFNHPYWFNQAHLYSPNPRVRGGWFNHFLANLLYIMPSTRPYDVEFDDGSPIPVDILYSIYDILDEETLCFEWQPGDLLVLDNIKTLHGRTPQEGEGHIFVSMFR